MRFRFSFLLLATLIVAPFAPAHAGVTVDQRAAFASACQHYANRARFVPRDGNEPFIATLADACETAMASLESANDVDHAKAVDFLMRLAILRHTVTDMTMTRVYGEDYSPFAKPRASKKTRTGSLGAVSATGEYLIAYRLGVVSAYRAWLDTEAAIAFASKRGIVQ